MSYNNEPSITILFSEVYIYLISVFIIDLFRNFLLDCNSQIKIRISLRDEWSIIESQNWKRSLRDRLVNLGNDKYKVYIGQ